MSDSLPTVAVTVPVAINEQRLRDILCNAIEGGSGYWASFRSIERTADLDYVIVRVYENEPGLLPGDGQILKATDLARGIQLLGDCAKTGTFRGGTKFPAAGQHLANFLDENDDAETADVILQMTVFGSLIYG